MLPSPWPRGLNIRVGYKEELLVGLLIFLVSFTLLNVLGWALRETESRNVLYALQVIGGHITAFAGISTFGTLQQAAMFRSHLGASVLVLALAALVLIGARCVSGTCRAALLRRLSDAEVAGGQWASESEERLQWAEQTAEAEDDATSLTMSFLMQQVVLFWLTGHLPGPDAGDDGHHSQKEIWHLFLCACGFLGFLVLTTNVRMGFKKLDSKNEVDWRERLGNLVQTFFAMSMSWCLLRIGEWQMRLFIQTHAMALVANALVMTAFSLVMIRILDCFADRLLPESEAELAAEAELAMESQALQSAAVSGELSQVAMQLLVRSSSGFALQDPVTHGNVIEPGAGGDVIQNLSNILAIAQRIVQGAQDQTQQERALRTVIDGFGLLVGLCWDKAFDASDETLVAGTEVSQDHPVLSKVLLAVFLVCIVLPGWMWFVVPKARMDWRDHAILMSTGANLQNRPRRRAQAGADGEALSPISSRSRGHGRFFTTGSAPAVGGGVGATGASE